MGTNNFNNTNASKVFVVTEDNELLYETLGDLLPDLWFTRTIKFKSGLRSYPSVSIGEITKTMTFLKMDFTIQIVIFQVSGYYEDSNLDWELTITHSGDDNFEADNVKDCIYGIDAYSADYYNIKPGIWAIHRHNLWSKLDKIVENLIKEVEEAFEKVSEPYRCVATASNGEAIYKKD